MPKKSIKQYENGEAISLEEFKAKHFKGNLKKENSPYDPVFVEKVLEGVKAKNEGEKGLRVDVENLWK